MEKYYIRWKISSSWVLIRYGNFQSKNTTPIVTAFDVITLEIIFCKILFSMVHSHFPLHLLPYLHYHYKEQHNITAIIQVADDKMRRTHCKAISQSVCRYTLHWWPFVLFLLYLLSIIHLQASSRGSKTYTVYPSYTSEKYPWRNKAFYRRIPTKYKSDLYTTLAGIHGT